MSAELLIPTGQADAGHFNDELLEAVEAVVDKGALPDEVAKQGVVIESDSASRDGVRVVERPATTGDTTSQSNGAKQ